MCKHGPKYFLWSDCSNHIQGSIVNNCTLKLQFLIFYKIIKTFSFFTFGGSDVGLRGECVCVCVCVLFVCMHLFLGHNELLIWIILFYQYFRFIYIVWLFNFLTPFRISKRKITLKLNNKAVLSQQNHDVKWQFNPKSAPHVSFTDKAVPEYSATSTVKKSMQEKCLLIMLCPFTQSANSQPCWQRLLVCKMLTLS